MVAFAYQQILVHCVNAGIWNMRAHIVREVRVEKFCFFRLRWHEMVFIVAKMNLIGHFRRRRING